MSDSSFPKIIPKREFLPVDGYEEETGSFYGEILVSEEREFYEKVATERLTVTGDAVFRDEIDAAKFDIEGTAVCAETVSCDAFICEGSALIKRKIMCEEAFVSGTCECYGNFHSGDVRVSGALKLGGRLDALDVEVTGSLHVSGKVPADNVIVEGKATFDNNLRAIDIRISGTAGSVRATSVRSENLLVRSTEKDPADFVFTADSLFCDYIKLEYCDADRVLCEEAVIGPGCHIRLLECREEPDIDINAVVEKTVMI